MIQHALLSALLLSACAGSPAPSSGGDDNKMSLFPTTMLYSGVETGAGAVTYKVTISAKGASGITWKSMTPSVASITGTDSLATVTALQAGQTSVTADAGSVHVAVPISITTYKPSDRMAATAMYTSTCAASGCHDAAGPDVSPSGIGKHTDAQILAAVTMGANPEGGELSLGAAAHSFSIATNSPQYAGIVAYLRALPPGTPVQDE